MILPATACFIQQGLGVVDVPSFDLAAACSGFIYGLAAADGFIAGGVYKNILLVAVDTLTKFTDYEDRGSCILFGDGAGAVVIRATDEPGKGLLYTKLGADGAGWDFIHMPAGGSRTPASRQTVDQRLHYIKMRGRDVYKFAVQKMAFLLEDGMAQCGLTVDDVDLVIPHQVNQRIIESATSRANFPMDKVYINIDRFGNTSGASIPLAMDEAKRVGRLKSGDIVLLVAFGAGLTWAGGVIKL
ncbi:MAG: beta-ketoacyl-ACP synthase 3, partial [Planctomycetes bacterium]|nr:beta-ketoacyl-ACP synthase 3 [Planctomycetota bacterium]